MGRVHVGDTPLQVARQITKEYPSEGYSAFRALPPVKRRYIIASALNEHGKNQSLYASVMRKKNLKSRWKYQFNKSGKTPKTSVIIP